MRFKMILALGLVFDLLALPVTLNIWKGLFHHPIAELLTDAG